jgi:V/A-type H+-transporting ATPase subunit E
MSLEKIIDKILQDAQKEADRIIAENQKKADEIKSAAMKDAEVLAESLLSEEERQGELEASRLLTQARLEGKVKILSYKKNLIDSVLEKAFQKQDLDEEVFRRKVILKDGEKEESFDKERLLNEIRPRLESYIAEVLGI